MRSWFPLTVSLAAGGAALVGCRDTAAPFAPIPARIAFVSDRRLGQSDIWLMNTDGSLQLVTDHLAQDDWPSWSPDGTHLAFESDRSSNYDIYSTTLTARCWSSSPPTRRSTASPRGRQMVRTSLSPRHA